MKKVMIRKPIIIFCLHLIWLTLLIWISLLCFSQNARSDPIWKIGDPERPNSCGEFIDTNQRIIGYVIPPEENEVWEGFPKFLYPPREGLQKTQEIRIDYEYPISYTFTALIVRARMSDPGEKQYLSAYRGEEATEQSFTEMHEMDDNYHFYRFLIGPMKEGSDSENRIILKTHIDTEYGPGTNSYIIFDTLWLEEYDIDLDKDGVFNHDEGDGDWDQDGDEDQSDKDTACIPIKNDDPSIPLIKKMYLDIIEQEGKTPSLKDVGFIDPNSLHIPLWLQHDSFIYYGYLGLKVNEIEPYESIRFKIGYPDAIHDDAGIYTYKGSSLWERREFDLQDTNIISITLQDGGAGDLDGQGDGIINTVLALSNPGTLEMEVKDEGCFIMCIKKKNESFHKGEGR